MYSAWSLRPCGPLAGIGVSQYILELGITPAKFYYETIAAAS